MPCTFSGDHVELVGSDAHAGDEAGDLFEESVQDALVPTEMQPELMTQLALLMYALIDAIEKEVHDDDHRFVVPGALPGFGNQLLLPDPAPFASSSSSA